MTFAALRVLIPAALLPVFMSHAGGWAVITVDELPDYAEAGKPVRLAFKVRQHGFYALRDLKPTVTATSGQRQTQTIRAPSLTGDQYVVPLELPNAGEWTITIKSGFGNSDLTLRPLTVVDQKTATKPALTETERGHRLYFSKGCVTCHDQIHAGPSLAGKRFDATYISAFLAKPPKMVRDKPAMPDLELKQTEIAALVTYLNSDRQVTSR